MIKPDCEINPLLKQAIEDTKRSKSSMGVTPRKPRKRREVPRKTPQAISPLLYIMKGKRDLVVAEIGVYKGESSLLMLTNWSISKFYAVDTWSSQVYAEKDADQRDLMHAPWNSIYKSVKKKLSPFSQVEILKGTSKEHAADLDNNILDFCFIDAAHDYESVKEDIHLWFPKVKKGGVIAGDDYHWPGVKRALGEASHELGFADTLIHVFDEYDCKTKQWYAIVE
tara:strand:+ start:932 stop:1606 length:675 start_codon:yes stop_codon:yes gene_type:complete